MCKRDCARSSATDREAGALVPSRETTITGSSRRAVCTTDVMRDGGTGRLGDRGRREPHPSVDCLRVVAPVALLLLEEAHRTSAGHTATPCASGIRLLLKLDASTEHAGLRGMHASNRCMLDVSGYSRAGESVHGRHAI